MRDIIDHLSDFSEESKNEETKDLDFNQVIEDSLILLREQLKNRKIRVNCNYDENLPPFHGNRNQLESILQNLLANSMDSFLETPSDNKKQWMITISTAYTLGNQIKVSYQDNALGMDQQTLTQLFDPFFTTKDPGKGTGLGMYIVQGLVKKHQGTITVKSTPQEGSEFILLFEAPAKTISKETTKEPANQKKIILPEELDEPLRLLLIDDDCEVLEVLESFLINNFNVTTLENPTLTEQTLLSNNFDLIMTDMKMPKINGVDIIKLANRLTPNTPLVLCSGSDQEDPEMKEALSYRKVLHVKKPIEKLEELSQKLKEHLFNNRER